MTANPSRRRRVTQLGAIAAVAFMFAAAVAVVVGISTLRTSEAGRAVAGDERVVEAFPSTPNLGVAIVDDLDRLTSLAIVTLDPSGVGGSIVTMPVNVDTTLGLGRQREPLSSRPFSPDAPEDAAALQLALESMLGLTVERALVIGPDGAAEFVDRISPLRVDLPQRVVDADSDGTGFVAAAGERSLTADQVVAALTAIDIDGTSYDQHAVDVALWSAIAFAGSSSRDVDVSLDEFGRPVAPTTPDELLDRLFTGTIGARDLAIDRSTARGTDNDDGADFVLLDRTDAILVFAEISPALVSTPNESSTFQIVARFNDEQVATVGEGSSTVGLLRELIGEIQFARGNVVSVRSAPAVEGVGEVTRLEVRDESLVRVVEEAGPILFGEVEVVVATRLVEGVDVVAVLGTDFLDHRAELRAQEEASAADSVDVDPTDGADFDISGDAPDVDSDVDPDIGSDAGSDAITGGDESTGSDDGSDTVPADE